MNPNTQPVSSPMPEGVSNQIPKAKVGAKDFFLYIGFIAAFYTFLTVLLTFTFSLINTIFPDRQFNYYDPYASSMRFSVSMLIVVAPLCVYLLSRIYKGIRANPSLKDLWVRKWFLYLTFTLSIVTLAINLVVLINTYLGGEISPRFIWKAVAVLVVGILVWLFTRYEIHGSLADNPKLSRGLGYGLLAAVLALIVIGFTYIGSPAFQRNVRDDNQREADLSSIKYEVLNYYQSKNAALPKTLEEMKIGNPYANALPTDPSTKLAYDYRILEPKVVEGQKDKYPTFELCATFAEDGDADKRVQGTGGKELAITDPSPMYPIRFDEQDFSKHKAGRTCFEISIDPLRYKPYNPEPAMLR
ncbi:MAG: hypothetical protein RIQ72_552 [Candidatus Parcubacteria bacterium]|jgi:hypothetical protein